MAPLAEGLEYTRHMLGWPPWPQTHLYREASALLGVSPRKVLGVVLRKVLGVAPRKVLGVAPRKVPGVAPHKAIYTPEQRETTPDKLALVSPCSAK